MFDTKKFGNPRKSRVCKVKMLGVSVVGKHRMARNNFEKIQVLSCVNISPVHSVYISVTFQCNRGHNLYKKKELFCSLWSNQVKVIRFSLI